MREDMRQKEKGESENRGEVRNSKPINLSRESSETSETFKALTSLWNLTILAHLTPKCSPLDKLAHKMSVVSLAHLQSPCKLAHIL